MTVSFISINKIILHIEKWKSLIIFKTQIYSFIEENILSNQIFQVIQVIQIICFNFLPDIK